MPDQLRWGILGTGTIARKFAEALAKSETGTLVAVGSRTQETADKFADEFGAPRRHGSYEAFVADGEIDAVYNSLPNHLHLEWTTQCAEAGRHVLCEKPLTVNHAEAVQMLDAVKASDVFLMEAFMYRCHPQTAKLVELIRDGALGEVRVIQAHFGYSLAGSDDPYGNIRLQNEVGGGSIMDVGCYTVSACRLIAGAALGQGRSAEPEVVYGTAHIGEVGRVDEWATGALKFANGIVANVTCGAMCAVGAVIRAWGSKGSLEVPNPWFPGRAPDVERILVTRDGKGTEEVTVPSQQGLLYTLEADAVARHLADRQAPWPCMTWEDSLGNMKTLDRWRQSVWLAFDCE
jgi:predicted dehydrogenase